MLEAVRDFRAATGRQVGVKPAGGIRTTKDAIKYLVLVNETVGDGLARPGLVPLRRLQPAQRPADAAHQADHRPLLRPRLLHAGLIADVRVRTRPRVPRGRRHQALVRAVHRRRVRRPDRRRQSSRRSTPPPRRCWPRSPRPARPTSTAPSRPPARRTTRSGARCPAAERAKYLFRIARIIQERSRELAVLESLDNGKPIRESRDVDLPLVAAHFFYYAGWADKLEHAGFGADPRPLGVAGQVIPWNFPLLMLAWKIAPALASGNTVVLKPAETTPLTALLFAEICQQADLPPGVVNIVTGAGDDRRGAGRAPRRRQGRLHRLDRGRQGHRPVGRRHRQEGSPWSSAARPPTSSSTTPRSTRPSRASSTASSSTRATSAAPARGCWSRSRWPTSCWTSLKRRMAHAAGRRPAGQEHRHRRDQLRRAAGPDPRAVGRRRGGGRRALVAAVRAARRAASGSRRPSSPASPRRTGSPARRSSARCCRC